MDEIQRKLELIDKQLAGGLANSHKQIISTSPLLFVAIGLIAGILIQNTFDLPVSIWLVLLALSTITTVFFLIIQRSLPTNYRYAAAYLALVCFVCLGGVRLITFHHPRSDDICNLINHELTRINTKKLKIKRLTAEGAENAKNKLKLNSVNSANSAVKENERKLATIRGIIITEPYINKNRDWKFARFMHRDPASSFYLKVKEVETTAGWAKASGTVRMQVAEPILDLKAGDYIQTYCWLARFQPPTNPGQFDTAKYLARKNVFLAASVQSRDGIELLENSGEDIFTKIKGKMRGKVAQALLDGSSPEDPSRGLLEALLLGYRGNIDSDIYQTFRKTGLLHFISLSGMHLGILAGIIWWLCKIAGLMKRGRAAICIIVIAIFLLVVPARAPTVRAAIICFVFCISFFFRRKSNPVNTLSLAAIILLLIRPTNLFEAGWHLSFASVLGIILFTGRIELFIYEKVTDRFWSKEDQIGKPFFLTIVRPGKYLLRLFCMGIAAWLGSAGILLYHFYTINPLTSIWTVIAFPLVAGILTFGFSKIILSFLLPSAAAALGPIVNGLSNLLIWIVTHIASWDISQIPIGHVSVTPVILYYCFVFFAGFVYFRRPLTKKAICTAMVLAIIIFLGATKWQRTHRDNLVLTVLDVSHGQAILAQLPGKANILFDAGSLHKADVGRRIIAPFLDYSGINKIDAIIISHNDIDHINGIPEITECCKVNDVYANNAFFTKTDKWGTAKFLDEQLSENGFKIQRLERDLNIGSSARIKTLWPSEQISQDVKLGDNDKSLVCLIEFAGKKTLLCSDIEKFAQREFLRLFPNLKAEVVVVPHHGSAKTLENGFLESLDADILISSCGRRDYERQRTTRTENKAQSFYTARDGATTVCITKDGTIKFVTQDL